MLLEGFSWTRYLSNTWESSDNFPKQCYVYRGCWNNRTSNHANISKNEAQDPRVYLWSEFGEFHMVEDPEHNVKQVSPPGHLVLLTMVLHYLKHYCQGSARLSRGYWLVTWLVTWLRSPSLQSYFQRKWNSEPRSQYPIWWNNLIDY